MRKNLLLMLFAIIFGVATATAETVNINVDRASNVSVTYGYSGAKLTLVDGSNTFNLTSADNPLTIAAANGAEIKSVTVDGSEIYPAGDGAYRTAISDMTVDIDTGADAPVEIRDYQTWFNVNPLGSISVSYDDATVIIDQEQYYTLPGKEVKIAPLAGYKITGVNYEIDWENKAVDNGDGTWTITPAKDYGFVTVEVSEEGIEFGVDVNLGSNVQLIAWTDAECSWEKPETSKVLTLYGSGPYTTVAPKDVYAVDFYPVQGGTIRSIKRIFANGKTEDLVYSDWVGWRAFVNEGDTFVIDAVGPEVDVTFAVLRSARTLDDFVFTVEGKNLGVTKDNATVGIHAGSIVSVAGAKGTALSGLYATEAGNMIVSEGSIQSFMVTKEGTVYVQGDAISDITLTIDNAAAVVITDKNGYGDVLTLTDGTNKLTAVSNPLSIVAAADYEIVSVVLDGMPVDAKSDGTYTAAVETGSTLVITTKEKQKAVPVTVSVIGDYTRLKVTNDDKEATLTAETTVLAAMPGTTLTFAPTMGYLIKDFQAGTGLYADYNEETELWEVNVNAAGALSIEVVEWVAAEGNALLTYSCDNSKVSALTYFPNGERDSILQQGVNELAKGSTVKFVSYGDVRLKSVKVNGSDIELDADNKGATYTVSEDATIDVTTYIEQFCTISGYQVSDPVTHSTIGYIYINEEGNSSYRAKSGETVTIIPVAAPGYKFNGFTWSYPENIIELISTTAPYTLVVPEGVDNIMVQGAFVADEEHKSYTINMQRCYVDGLEYANLSSVAFTTVITPQGFEGTQVVVLEGSEVELQCYVADDSYVCQWFCLYTDARTKVPQKYVVNGEHADEYGVIRLSAYVTSGNVGVDEVAGDALAYNAAAHLLTAPAEARVFSLGGQLMTTLPAGENSLESLAEGIYIVVCEGQTIKIVR